MNYINKLGIRFIKIIAIIIMCYLFLLSIFSTSIRSVKNYSGDALNPEWGRYIYFLADNPIKHLFIILSVIFILLILKSFMNEKKGIIRHKAISSKTICVFFFLFSCWFVLNTQFYPKSDPGKMLRIAQEILNGDYHEFAKEGYMYRYPYQSGFVLYCMLALKIFNQYAFLMLQIFNAAFLTAMYFFLTKCAELLWECKRHETINTLVYMLCSIPLFFYITFIYGNIPGLSLAVIAIYFELRFFRESKFKWILGASLCMGIAVYMSMVGIRDMSLLETPPQARYPVQTYVMEYQDSVIRDAILRELGRGGQVFFLYNRVGSIDQCYRQLQKLVPEARIAIAHGQMRENALEDVMLDFSQQKFDVLLCTTIIESGLDIPLANTLIIYDADHFGLSQLYQTRGRVGRSNRLAYAYFTVRPGKVLSETAQKRLDAIREFTEFGSGFRIAMRDLELRGAGNLLGPQQSGHLANIGYDLYCKLLEEAVLEAQGQEPVRNRDIETRMDVHVNAYLPAEYVTGDRQRLEVYKRIASIRTAEQRDDIEDELIDRFGDEPQCVANLVAVAYLKAMCMRLGIERVIQTDGRIDMRFAANAQVDGEKLFKALQGFDKRLTLNAALPVTLCLRDRTLAREDMLHLAVKVMERLLERMDKLSA